MEILNSIFYWIIKKRIHEVELFTKYPIDVQLEVFHKLRQQAKDTEWGKKHGYKDIKTVAAYKKRFPVQDYETIKKDVLRMKHGEQNILWSSEIKWFAKSSGTTSDRSKYIPVSHEALEDCHYKGGKDMLSIYCNHYPDSKVFAGKSMILGGNMTINQFSSDSYYGDLSSIIIENIPWWAEFRRTPSKTLALMGEWEEKIEKMARVTAKQDIRNISGVPSWMLVFLRKVLEVTGKSNVLEVWPYLEIFFHGGVSFSPYRELYRELIPSDGMHYLENYNASEGFFALQDQKDSQDLLLMLDYGIFYEFMPLDEVGKDDPQTLGLDEVELGETYAIVISTNGGLWRYMIGDTVRFTSLSPFRIRVAGRTKFYINAFGEELMQENAEQGLATACEKTGAVIQDYTAGPVFMTQNGKGGHQWLIEFEKEPASLDYFQEVLDNALKSLNSDYEAKRYKNMTLVEPSIISLPSGTFYAWMRKRGKIGGQNKVPRLANDRKHLDAVLDFIDKRSSGKSHTA